MTADVDLKGAEPGRDVRQAEGADAIGGGVVCGAGQPDRDTSRRHALVQDLARELKLLIGARGDPEQDFQLLYTVVMDSGPQVISLFYQLDLLRAAVVAGQ